MHFRGYPFFGGGKREANRTPTSIEIHFGGLAAPFRRNPDSDFDSTRMAEMSIPGGPEAAELEQHGEGKLSAVEMSRPSSKKFYGETKSGMGETLLSTGAMFADKQYVLHVSRFCRVCVESAFLGMFERDTNLGPPVVPFYQLFWGLGSPTKID